MRGTGRLRLFLRSAVGPSRLLPGRVRPKVYRAAGIGVGAGTHLEPGQHIVNDRLTFGERCYVNEGCHFDPGHAAIDIGDDVNIGARCILAAASHEIGPSERRAQGNTSAPIRVGAGAWLGARVTVLPGVTIGSGCVVGAGSVVTSDLEPDAVYVGVPARLVRRLS